MNGLWINHTQLKKQRDVRRMGALGKE